MANVNPLADALADVRRAYRLLAAYQKRIIDYTQSIANHLQFEYYHADPRFDLPNKNNPYGRWAWDYLPLSRWDFLFLKHQEANLYPNLDVNSFPLEGDMLLAIVHEPDSGLVAALNGVEPNPAGFTPAQDCQSRLGLWLFINRVNLIHQTNWYYSIYKSAARPQRGQVGHHAKPQAANPQVANWQVDSYYEEFNLADLPDVGALLAAVNGFAANAGRELGVQLP